MAPFSGFNKLWVSVAVQLIALKPFVPLSALAEHFLSFHIISGLWQRSCNVAGVPLLSLGHCHRPCSSSLTLDSSKPSLRLPLWGCGGAANHGKSRSSTNSSRETSKASTPNAVETLPFQFGFRMVREPAVTTMFAEFHEWYLIRVKQRMLSHNWTPTPTVEKICILHQELSHKSTK